MPSNNPTGRRGKRRPPNALPRKGKIDPLSVVETEVAILVSHGFNNKNIGEQLGLRLHTIQNIKNRCYIKLRMRKRDGYQPQVQLTLWTLQKLNRLFAKPHEHFFHAVLRCTCGVERPQ